MTCTKQPLSPVTVDKTEIGVLSPKNQDPLAVLIDSFEKLEAEMRDFEQIADNYFDKLNKSRDQ